MFFSSNQLTWRFWTGSSRRSGQRRQKQGRVWARR